MSERAEALASQFERMNDDLIATVERCPDAQWSAKCADTGWTANVQAHHIAAARAGLIQVLGAVAGGEKTLNMDSATLDRINAKHAQEYANVSRETVVADLHTSGAAAADWIRGLSDEQLDRKATFQSGAPEASLEQLVQFAFLGEIERHGGNLRQAVGASS
jgi:uncharacterized damage-inducible protein DinB